MMKPTTIYLPEATEASLQELAKETGKSIPELIQELIDDYLTKRLQKLPKSLEMGANGSSDLSSKTEQLLQLYREFMEEDRQLAEAGINEYADLLTQEDQL